MKARQQDAPKRVCMLVWNTFTHDARVIREAKTLVAQGYAVTVVAVHDPFRTRTRETMYGFDVVRIHRGLPELRLGRRRLGGCAAGDPVQAPSARVDAPPPEESLTPRSTAAQVALFLPRIAYRLARQTIRWLWKPLRWLVIPIRFYRAANAVRADIIHAHDLNTLPQGYLAARRRGAKLVYDAHEISTSRVGDLWKYTRFWKQLESYLIRRANAVITTDEMRADFLADTYRVPRPTVLLNVTERRPVSDVDLLRTRLDIPADMPIVIYQGGLQPDRGLEQLIRSVPEIERGVVVFVGDGRLREALGAMAEEHQVAHRVHFVAAVPPERLLDYTASADVGVQVLQNTCFNHYSTTSNKLFEYFMAGIPVVASDFPEIRRVVQEFDAGVLIDPCSPTAIAKGINAVLSDPVRYDALRRNAVRAAEKYNWDNEQQKLIAVYRRLADGGATS